MAKPIIIQILPQLNSGGVERTTVDMAGFLTYLDDVPTYVVSAGGTLVSELEKTGCKHITLPVHTKNPITILMNAARLVCLIRRTHAQILHVHSRAPAWSVLLASKITGTPYLTTYHGAYKNRGKLSNWYNSAMVRGNCVIAISEFISSIIQRDHGFRSPTILKIAQGIDTHLFDPQLFSVSMINKQKSDWGIPLEAPVLLCIGRLTKGKRIDLAIMALSQLKTKDAHLMIVGSDNGRRDLTQSLKDLAHSEGVSDRVHFIDNCQNIPLAYAVSDLVLFPTELQETFGRISAEAGAMGKIIIASNGGAIPEVILDKQTGYLFEAGDLNALVARIQDVFDMTEVNKKAMEQSARNHIEKNFSADKMFFDTLKIYEEIRESN